MKKVWTTVFLIFATIVGSGFSSGKEIFVFFSRFGYLSYLYIFLACLMFFALFYLFLSKGYIVIERLEKSKILNFSMIFISIVFCASMFAGIKTLFAFSSNFMYIFLCALLLGLCLLVAVKGFKALEKVSFLLMPFCSFIFLTVLIFICTKKSDLIFDSVIPFGFFYCPLYVALNFSTSTFVVSKAGYGLSRKQIFLISLFSTLLLFIFLTFGNFVLTNHPDSFYAEMPFLFLCQDNAFFFILCYIVILIGCLTTLLSLCVTLKNSISGFVKSEGISISISVFLPFLISEIGFSIIVSHIYPLASILGIFILFFFIVTFRKSGRRPN